MIAELHGMKSPRIATILSILIVTPAGFLFKFYTGPFAWWLNDYGAGILYEIFWVLVFFLFYPSRRSAHRIALWVFIGTSALEVLQLWHPWFLERIRSHFLGSALDRDDLFLVGFPALRRGMPARLVLDPSPEPRV